MILPYMNMIQLQQKYCLSLVYLLLYYFVSPYKTTNVSVITQEN